MNTDFQINSNTLGIGYYCISDCLYTKVELFIIITCGVVQGCMVFKKKVDRTKTRKKTFTIPRLQGGRPVTLVCHIYT